MIKVQPFVGSSPTQKPSAAETTRKASTSARAARFLVAAVCFLIAAVIVSQLVAGFAWEWVSTGVVACVVLAVVGFFAVPHTESF